MSSKLMNPEEFLMRLGAWLIKYRPELDAGSLTWEVDLIDSRIIDSMLFVEYMLFLEDIMGAELGDALGSINNFRTPQSSYQTLARRHGEANPGDIAQKVAAQNSCA